jgi:hypothetical protein
MASNKLRFHTFPRQRWRRPVAGNGAVARGRRQSASAWLVERAGAAEAWSVHEVLGMLNPVKKLLRLVAIALAAVTLAVRLWALIYRALAFMALDPRLGVFPATKHRQAVRRIAFAGFVAAMSLEGLAEGHSIAYVTWTSSIAMVGGVVGDRRATRALAEVSHGRY